MDRCVQYSCMQSPYHMLPEVLLSIAPATLTYFAWQSQRRLGESAFETRLLLFRGGLVASIVYSIIIGCWLSRSLFIADGKGGYSDRREDMMFLAASCSALLTTVLVSFGRGRARLLLLGNGLILLALAFNAILSNGV